MCVLFNNISDFTLMYFSFFKELLQATHYFHLSTVKLSVLPHSCSVSSPPVYHSQVTHDLVLSNPQVSFLFSLRDTLDPTPPALGAILYFLPSSPMFSPPFSN